MTDLPYEIATAPAEVQQRYRRMIRNGQDERFAVMCALGQAPGTRGSDRAFMEGRLDGSWLNRMPPHQARRMLREAQAAGISTIGKTYIGGLADSRGHRDPMAWVDSVADVKRVAVERNLEVTGIVTHRAREVPPPQHKDISDSILAENVAAERKKNPTAKAAELVEKVKDRIVPHWKRKK
jgi:hypothetical protein